jgi:hypothetical protein
MTESESKDLMGICPTTGKLYYSGITARPGSSISLTGFQTRCGVCGQMHAPQPDRLIPGSRLEQGASPKS